MTTTSAQYQASPFVPGNDERYRRWRDWKLEVYPRSAADLRVPLRDPLALTGAEVDALRRRCAEVNMVIYDCPESAVDGKTIARQLGQAFGLRRLDPNMLADDDGITSLTVVPGKLQRGYIPYSDKRLLWHTDGYYNPPQRRIRAMLLHCAAAAAEGGENSLIDHEMAYLLLREQDPAYIAALMAPDAMTIPANTEAAGELRPAQAGPVFSVDEATGSLHMRYTARTRSIEWKDNAVTAAAVAALETLLASDTPYIIRHRLKAGQGLLCNNVLHNRTAFVDEPSAPRLLYRARYYDRIAGTGLNETTRAN